jgi:hypothetical protein
MGKVGRWVTDPKAGAYCTITLDSREKIIINHDKGGFKGGRVAIERLKLFGSALALIASSTVISTVSRAKQCSVS